jgi:branched-subunit amino acid ABC-type transport system permease component
LSCSSLLLPAFVTIVVDGGDQYCLLALAFAFVWWSSRTFFVARAALIPMAGAMLFTLVTSDRMGTIPFGVIAVVACTALAAAMGAAMMRAVSIWRRGSGRGGLSGSAALDGAIVSFAFFLLLVNLVRWAVGTETDSLTLCGEGVLADRHYGIAGAPLQLRTNAIGLVQIIMLWSVSIALIAWLCSRLGLQLGAAKRDLQLFGQIGGKGGTMRPVAVLFCWATAGLIGVLMTCTVRMDLKREADNRPGGDGGLPREYVGEARTHSSPIEDACQCRSSDLRYISPS